MTNTAATQTETPDFAAMLAEVRVAAQRRAYSAREDALFSCMEDPALYLGSYCQFLEEVTGYGTVVEGAKRPWRLTIFSDAPKVVGNWTYVLGELLDAVTLPEEVSRRSVGDYEASIDEPEPGVYTLTW